MGEVVGEVFFVLLGLQQMEGVVLYTIKTETGQNLYLLKLCFYCFQWKVPT